MAGVYIQIPFCAMLHSWMAFSSSYAPDTIHIILMLHHCVYALRIHKTCHNEFIEPDPLRASAV